MRTAMESLAVKIRCGILAALVFSGSVQGEAQVPAMGVTPEAAADSFSAGAQVPDPADGLNPRMVTSAEADSGSFAITGDPLPGVRFTPMPILLLPEQRQPAISEVLIGEDDRLRRVSRFAVTTGPGGDILFTTGARDTNDLYARMGYDAGGRGGALRVTHWSSDEHTRTNRAPLAGDFGLMGYGRSPQGEITLDIGYARQRENGGGPDRPDDRSLDRYRGNAAFRTGMFENWEVRGNAGFVRGVYRDVVYENENRDLLLAGSVEAVRAMGGGELRASAAVDRYELEGLDGYLASGGAHRSWLFGNTAGVSAGALVAMSAMPGGATRLRAYPNLSLDVLLTPRLTFRAAFRPRTEAHTFGDLYDQNGLIGITAPVLYEHFSSDLDAELGFRFGSLTVGLGGSYRESAHAPVFTRIRLGREEYFDIVGGAELTRSAMTLRAAYHPSPAWHVEGEWTANRASWNYSGDVPYIPVMEAAFTGTYTPGQAWTFQAQAHFSGKHAVELNSAETEASFLLIDLGAERVLVRDSISLFMELRNITDADGSWWSGNYRIPGIGFYMGAKTHY